MHIVVVADIVFSVVVCERPEEERQFLDVKLGNFGQVVVHKALAKFNKSGLARIGLAEGKQIHVNASDVDTLQIGVRLFGFFGALGWLLVNHEESRKGNLTVLWL